MRTSGEPSIPQVSQAVDSARQFKPDVIVAVGGGSAIDTAKSVGVLSRNSGDILDHIEVVGRGMALKPETIPVVACPTTSGAGAEVTANSPIISPEHGVKASLRSPAMLPAIALVDPELTVSGPAAVTASSGFDALTQCIEPFVSVKANVLTDQIAAEGMRRAASGLRRAWTDGADIEARTDMSLCSLFGGLSLANAKLGAVHGLAAPIGGVTGGAHGEICAAMLAAATRVNVQSMIRRDFDNPALARYDTVAKLLTGRPEARAADGVEWLARIVADLRVPGLAALGLRRSQVDEAAEAAMRASSMKGNPIVLTHDEVAEIIETSM
ncbi:MAG: iron-containing alcohol dehydrogenase [Acidipropionibacterium jensenii]|uniref:iron-containing alcohol dehydrogenase n=1 Tax=Acidipropionibacterium jensenii TaxID=1749 RepID=UPI0026484D8B|nr:iron-containing alcohol dehydrogenase [Acidipropionibacterium jensenii]MDN6512020.1 iron-containing alcohol dehydrogenase [Acidipropionibacterium jensenii]